MPLAVSDGNLQFKHEERALSEGRHLSGVAGARDDDPAFGRCTNRMRSLQSTTELTCGAGPSNGVPPLNFLRTRGMVRDKQHLRADGSIPDHDSPGSVRN